MKVLETRALRGPNYYSKNPVIFMKLDIEELEVKPTDLVPNFKENISMMMPTLQEHTCSPGRVGGFYERLITGTWAGHVIEHVAIELQCLSGHPVTFGKTFTMNEEGIYNVVFRYLDENTGIRAGEMAVKIVVDLFNGKVTPIEPLVEELKRISSRSMLGPSTASIVDEAARRGIPSIRLNKDSYVQLGQGKYQRRIEATLMDNTSALGVEIAHDKERTKSILSSIGIPVPQGYSADTVEEAIEVANSVGYPVVVKPLSGNHGRGITINITNEEELVFAFKKAKEICDTVLIEQFLYGFDFRILVIDGKFVAAALREPAFVIGNGRDTIRQLIEETNKDPERGVGHEKSLTQITIDSMTEKLLELQELTLESKLSEGKKVYVKYTANLSSGGIAKDVTDTVHPSNKLMAERISQIIGLNVMGIDIIASSLEIPLHDQLAGIVEVNAGPGFRMHLNPSEGSPRNIASNIVDMLFPAETPHSVPVIAVTGTNGKTTTTRLIAHILEGSGAKVGMTSTDAVYINQVPLVEGDYSGPEGALKVLTDSTIDHAVLEVARGGILRRGLGFSESDVGVLLNISSDHLGENGIDSLEQLARLKSTVTEAVKESGYAVFNADDPLVLSCVDKTKASVILFSKDPQHPALKANQEKGNLNVITSDGMICVQKNGQRIEIASINDTPITFNGKAEFNIENVLAAVAVSIALGINTLKITQGLMSFTSSIDQTPGRMNIIDMGDFKVLVDYGHNAGAILATGDFLTGLMPGKKIRMSSSAGNRQDEHIFEYGLALSKYSTHIVLCDPDIRSRKLGETAEIVKQGLLKGGFTDEMITVIVDERLATQAALDMAGVGDLVVLQGDNVKQVIKDVLAYKEKLRSQQIAIEPSLAVNG
jgi:cyanophycin synthetase